MDIQIWCLRCDLVLAIDVKGSLDRRPTTAGTSEVNLPGGAQRF